MDDLIESRRPFDPDDEFREFQGPLPSMMERDDVDQLGWVDPSTTISLDFETIHNPARLRDPILDWRDGDNTDEYNHSSCVHNTEHDVARSDSSTLNQAPPFTPGCSSESSQVSSMHYTPTAHDQDEDEVTRDRDEEGPAMATRPSKKDRRGSHWKEKAQQGEACPQPSQGNTEWAEKVQKHSTFYISPSLASILSANLPFFI
jgi:hypothetical protein